MTHRSKLAVAACTFDVPVAGDALQLLPAGQFRATDGRPEGLPGWRLDDAAAAALVADVAARATPLVIDYEHQTLNAPTNGQAAPAAGWFKSVEWRPGVGLFATGVEWTDRARQMIAAREYRFVSPVFAFDPKTGVPTRLLHAALTNVPALDDLAEVTLRAAARFNTSEEEPAVNKLFTAIIAALGLPEGSTEDQAAAAVAQLKSEHGQANSTIAALKSQVPDPGKYVSIAQHQAVVDQVAALTAAQGARELTEIVTLAIDDGRLAATDETWARDFAAAHGIAALRESLAKRPVIAALRRPQTGGKPPAGADQVHELGEEDLAVCKQLGLSPDDYKKANAAA